MITLCKEKPIRSQVICRSNCPAEHENFNFTSQKIFPGFAFSSSGILRFGGSNVGNVLGADLDEVNIKSQNLVPNLPGKTFYFYTQVHSSGGVKL